MIISYAKIIAFQLSLFCKKLYRFSKIVLYIVNRKIHECLEIPDLFLVFRAPMYYSLYKYIILYSIQWQASHSNSSCYALSAMPMLIILHLFEWYKSLKTCIAWLVAMASFKSKKLGAIHKGCPRRGWKIRINSDMGGRGVFSNPDVRN
jgi:hypothetical protein